MAFINHEERVMDKCKCDDCERGNDGLGCARGLLFALPLGLLLWGLVFAVWIFLARTAVPDAPPEQSRLAPSAEVHCA